MYSVEYLNRRATSKLDHLNWQFGRQGPNFERNSRTNSKVMFQQLGLGKNMCRNTVISPWRTGRRLPRTPILLQVLPVVSYQVSEATSPKTEKDPESETRDYFSKDED